MSLLLQKINAESSAPKKVNPLLKTKLNPIRSKDGSTSENKDKPKINLLANALKNKKQETENENNDTTLDKVLDDKLQEELKEVSPPIETVIPEKQENEEETEIENNELYNNEESADENTCEEETNNENENEKADDEEAENNEESSNEEISEEKPKQKRNRRKKQAEKVKEEEEEDTAVELAEIPKTKVDFNEAVLRIQSSFEDPEWDSMKESIQQELDSIVIEYDMNPGDLKVRLSELSTLRQKIAFMYQHVKNLYESLSGKEPEGVIERIKRINSVGSNDMERRRNGILACMRYDNDINLYEVLDEVRSRYNFLKYVMDSIQYKTNALITMNGALKLEKDHLQAE